MILDQQISMLELFLTCKMYFIYFISLIIDKLNAALVSIRDFFQKHLFWNYGNCYSLKIYFNLSINFFPISNIWDTV